MPKAMLYVGSAFLSWWLRNGRKLAVLITVSFAQLAAMKNYEVKL